MQTSSTGRAYARAWSMSTTCSAAAQNSSPELQPPHTKALTAIRRTIRSRDRGQQKPGDGRHHKAEQHFVDMPCERVEAARERASGNKDGDPQQQCQCRPRPGGEKKRPKAIAQESGRSPKPSRAASQRAHNRPALVRGSIRGPGTRRTTKPGRSGRNLTTKSQAISNAPSAKTTSPGRRIHCQRRV